MAATASVELVDPDAVAGLAAFWAEDPSRVARLIAFHGLVQALAAVDEKHDAGIVTAYEALAQAAPWKAVDDSIMRLVEQHPRTVFRHLRARLLHTWARDSEMSPEEARAQLQIAQGAGGS